MDHHLINAIVLVVALGVAAQWLSWRFKLPAIVLFLIVGVFAGPVFGWVNPSEEFSPLYNPIVKLAVAVILFVGGLNLHLHELKEAASGVKRMVVLGVPLSWLFGTLTAYYIGNLTLAVALVFGAVMVVTGPTVIMPLLRQANLNRRTASYLKWEAIINDPIGALLSTIVLQYFLITANSSDNVAAGAALLSLGEGVLGGIVLGGGAGYLLGLAFRYGQIPEFLKAPVLFGLVLVVYALADMIAAEAGLLAVTVMGLVMGNMALPSMEEMRRFKEYLSVLLVSSVFVLLTADLKPDVLRHFVDWHTIGLVLAMLFLVRPAVGWLATIGSGVSWRDRALISWIAPRGVVASAVAGVFGPALSSAGYADAELLLPLIFAVVFATVLAHGFSLGILARWLGLSIDPNGVLLVGASPWTTELGRMLTNELKLKVLLIDSSWHRLREARLAGVRVIYGELLSENFQQSLELNEISCLLAATSNDAYNSLVCHHFASDLEHYRVFQLPMSQPEDHSSKAVARPLRGTVAFGDSAHYEDLWRRHFQGWRFFKTRITESFTYEQFQRECPPDAIQVAIVRDDGKLVFCAAQNPVKPRVDDTIVYYAPGKAAEDTASARKRVKAENRERAREDEIAAASQADSGPGHEIPVPRGNA